MDLTAFLRQVIIVHCSSSLQCGDPGILRSPDYFWANSDGDETAEDHGGPCSTSVLLSPSDISVNLKCQNFLHTWPASEERAPAT